jgi:methionyl-tRNA synthetase
MAEHVLVSVAWPYANGPFHVGHIAGAYLPADIFARYSRQRGRDVLMVSGSDCHGTPITLAAEKEGVLPQAIINRYHASFIETLHAMGITFDLFTQTYTDNHYAATTDIFEVLQSKGYIYRETAVGSYSESLGRFLPDRFVEGICPNCKYDKARGDQCDKCGQLRDPKELGSPRSTVDGAPVTFRDTEHFYLDLEKLEPNLRTWLDSTSRDYWRSNTLAFTQNWLREGLHGRAITRDLEWGVPVPGNLPEFKDKRIYVWFDAVIGYYSASLEWAKRTGQPDAWRAWWDPTRTAKGYYFIGKDNIPFHTIIWPAMLLGYGDRALPFDVPANEFLNLEGEKMSTSRNWALWMPDLLTRYEPDLLRYYLTAAAPEGKDSNWSWAEFVQRVNSELVATWGNLANRVLTLSQRNFGGVPTPGDFLPVDTTLMNAIEEGFGRTQELYEAVKLRAALQEAMSLAQLANQYLSEQEPWKVVKVDPTRAGTVIFVALRAVDSINRLMAPIMPHACQRLHAMLGYDDVLAPQPDVASEIDPDGQQRPVLTGDYRYHAGWHISTLTPGTLIREPAPLFRKLDDSLIAEELARLGTK